MADIENSEVKYGQEEIIAEYTQAATYHNAQVAIRFTIAGFYMAGICFLAQTVLTADNWCIRSVGSFMGFLISGCLWIMDLRTRSLYTLLARRCTEIEHDLWGLEGSRWYQGTFSRLFKIRPPDSYHLLAEVPASPDRDWPEALELSWVPKSWRNILSLCVSHSIALSALYLCGFFVSLTIFGTSIYKMCFK